MCRTYRTVRHEQIGTRVVGQKNYLLGQLMIREWIGMRSLPVELLLGFLSWLSVSGNFVFFSLLTFILGACHDCKSVLGFQIGEEVQRCVCVGWRCRG
jgi:hypothetical protein